jgi:hypothetical protein
VGLGIRRSNPAGVGPRTCQDVGIHFVVGGTRFRLFRSGRVASGTHTQLAFVVDNLNGLVLELKPRGLEFETYDYPSLKTVDGIADLGYAHAAWFKDSEGNLLGIAELRTAGT